MKLLLLFALLLISFSFIACSVAATPLDDFIQYVQNLFFPPSIEETSQGSILPPVTCVARGGKCKNICGSGETEAGYCRIGGGARRDSELTICCVPKPTTTTTTTSDTSSSTTTSTTSSSTSSSTTTTSDTSTSTTSTITCSAKRCPDGTIVGCDTPCPTSSTTTTTTTQTTTTTNICYRNIEGDEDESDCTGHGGKIYCGNGWCKCFCPTTSTITSTTCDRICPGYGMVPCGSSCPTTTTTPPCTSTGCQWGIQYFAAAGATNGLIPKGSKIQVVYKPATTQYINAGEKISAPGNAFSLGFSGWNTDKFSNINVKPIIGITAYYSDNVSLSNLNGLEVASDVANGLQIASVQSNKFYFLYDKINGTNYPLILAYFDTPAGKIGIISITNVNSAPGIYQLTINYGDAVTPYFIQYSSATSGNSLSVITAGISGVAKVFANYNFKSSWTASNAAELKLGNSSAASEPEEVQAITEGTTFNVGLSHNDVVADGGLILKNPNENGWSDRVSLKVPDKELKTTVNFEYTGHAITTDIRLDKSFAEDFPNNGIVNMSSGVFDWKSNSYDFHEQVDVSRVKMRHDYGTTSIQGIEKMQVQDGNIVYEYVFDKDLNFNGSITNPQYTYPVKIKLMNKDFLIVGAGSYSVKALMGSVGTATATSGVAYGNYKVYSDTGGSGWARILIKDKTGTIVDTLTINSGDSHDSSVASLTIKILTVNALQDGTIIGTDLVVGPIGSVEKEYDSAADVTSVGTNDCFSSSTTCKKTCPYLCCNADDPNYNQRSCPRCACAPCLKDYPCPACNCSEMICQDHKCVGQALPRFNLTFKSGWNMMSFPVQGTQDVSSDCKIQSSWRYVNGKYVAGEGSYPGYGYWLKVANDCSMSFSGNPVTSTSAFPKLDKGWNMIGSLANSTLFADIKGDCNVASGPWWYNPSSKSYEKATSIEPGKGYFLKVSQSCRLSSVSTPPEPPGE